MSPRSSVSSSSSNGEKIRNSFNEEYSGMSGLYEKYIYIYVFYLYFIYY